MVDDAVLEPTEGMERQLLDGVGAGIRYLAVEHEERSQSSPEEAARIAEEIEFGRAQVHTAAEGRNYLRCEDVMVLAPDNAQVRRLRSRLPAEVRVGTVDRFQGQEALSFLLDGELRRFGCPARRLGVASWLASRRGFLLTRRPRVSPNK